LKKVGQGLRWRNSPVDRSGQVELDLLAQGTRKGDEEMSGEMKVHLDS
jgi:hypothetical protein